ncbi:TIGR00303 family protein [Leptolyngbya sp. 'hensonii']|uniref:nicotinate mononucleotide-dependent phosphoribosyltransferase CobT n=1 Tax=Leptolyngbya sp. 'hensonii' TaxID=1922337 RepID=UPI0009502E03|nr:TIGR00303 family protein [Leptolyngbya sp. 'hensonii']OLP17787.1 TIGR00303 family protein [Leptolyngbya sp. 'hensonii']
MLTVYTQSQQGWQWLECYRNQKPLFACILGFTETGLIPGISAAGATPDDRRYTAIADAEFLYHGPQLQPQHALPPLQAGATPALISRAVLAAQQIPISLFNAGLPQPPTVPCIDLEGSPAACVSTGKALDIAIVHHLLQQGLDWGARLADSVPGRYLILGECVVGGTTTALALLTGLGYEATTKVNSSHPACNHRQKWAVVRQGIQAMVASGTPLPDKSQPLEWVAAVGDPMQVVVAGMAIAASRTCGVLLAGGTQMLAVYALARTITEAYGLSWKPQQVIVGTTRWVAEDPTGDTIGLAVMIGGVSLIATQLSFATSSYPQLRAYEQGYVKEGVGAGGCAIAAHLYQAWGQSELLQTIDALLAESGTTGIV